MEEIIAIITKSVFCFMFLASAYIGFFRIDRNKRD